MVGALAVVSAAAAQAPSGMSASMASLAVFFTLPAKLPAALRVVRATLFEELRRLEKVLDLCDDLVISGDGAGRCSEVMMLQWFGRKSAK